MQARARKKENDLRKCEEAITALEQQLSEIEAMMILPEVATDVAKLQELTSKQDKINANLAALYDQWEELAN